MKNILLLIAMLISQLAGNVPPEVTNKQASIILVGDIMLGRTVMTTSLDKSDPLYPFLKVADTLKTADLVFANLENPIVENCPRHTSGFKFCADPKMLEGLIYSEVDVVTIANNHTKNYGLAGFEETKKYLDDNEIAYVGDNNLVIKEVDGTKFGFIGFDFLTNIPTDRDYQFVKDSDGKVDVLVVGVHWGVEYKSQANNSQVSIGHKLIESGADIIAGHHPHWVQNIEYIDNKPVYYSLGNFIFDQMWSEDTKKGLAIKLVFEGGKVVTEEKIQTYMSDWAQPEISSTTVTLSKD